MMQGAEGMSPAYITKEQFDRIETMRVHHVQKSGCSNKVCLSESKIESYLLDKIEPEMNRIKIEYEKIVPSEAEKDRKQEISQLKAKLSKRLKQSKQFNFAKN